MPDESVLMIDTCCDLPAALVGPVIGAHTGPGMLAVVFWGEAQ